MIRIHKWLESYIQDHRLYGLNGVTGQSVYGEIVPGINSVRNQYDKLTELSLNPAMARHR